MSSFDPYASSQSTAGGEEDRCYTDQEITATFGDAYDHPQIHDGYQDDGDYFEQPFRFVKNWSLWSSSGVNPHVLPTDNGKFTGKKYANAHLQGFVVPPEDNSHYDPIKIRLDLTTTTTENQQQGSGAYVSVDRSKRYRGFWIIIPNGNCYWLHEPDESIHPGRGAQKSQADVHFDHIAWLAVLSNLMDAVFTLNGSAWANESVNDVYERLSNDKQPPFDKDLLVQYKDKIYPHLLHSQLYLTEGCKFLASLKQMRPPKKPKDRKNRLQIQASTNAALERSRQYPWGEPIFSIPPLVASTSTTSSPIMPASVPQIMHQQQQQNHQAYDDDNDDDNDDVEPDSDSSSSDSRADEIAAAAQARVVSKKRKSYE